MTKSVYTWFEVNDTASVPAYLADAHSWPGTPVISSRISNAVTIAGLAIADGLPVISGFKTFDAFDFVGGDSIEDSDAWATIAATARSVSDATDGRPVVLEHETMIQEWRDAGGTTVNTTALLAAISAQDWPKIWWYYGPVGSGEPLAQISWDLATAAISGITSCRLVEPASSGYATEPAWLGQAQSKTRTLDLDANPLSLVYLSDTSPHHWPLTHAPDAGRRSAGDIMLYPGAANLDRHGDIGELILMPTINDHIHRWPFDGSLADVAGSSDFTCPVGTPTYQDGVVGQEVVIPTGVGNMLTTPSVETMNPGAGSFSVAFWMTNDGQPGLIPAVAKKADILATSPGWMVYTTTSNRWGFSIADGTNRAIVLESGGAPVGVRSHWVAVLDRSDQTMKLYRDGALLGSTVVDGTVAGVSSISNAVATSIDPASTMTTSIDELRFYSRALSAQDVAELYAFTGNGYGKVFPASRVAAFPAAFSSSELRP